jgi:UPF0755 protein
LTKKNKVTSAAAFAFLSAVVLACVFFGYQLLVKPVGLSQTEIVFEVPPGQSFMQTAHELQQKKLIRNAKVFQWYARFRGFAGKVKVGEYSLNQGMTPAEIASVLVSGKSIARSITVAEGLNIFDIAAEFEKLNICTQKEFFEIVEDKAFIKSLLGEDLASLEGYLYPETYKYTKYEGAKSIITAMVKRFLTVWNEQLAGDTGKLPWTRHQVVTLASIIEKETGASSERPLISSVFHNRIAKKMRLQTDPTVLYGMAVRDHRMPTNISKNDLLTPTPYNTYTIDSLPPGPVANPGKEALLAALNPATSKYLFFVSQNNGTHVFSETIQQHNKAVQQFQLNAKARENKSWRDLKQSKK